MIARVSIDGTEPVLMTEAALAAILDIALAMHSRITVDVDWIVR